MLNQRVKVSSSTYLAPPIVNMVQNDSGRVLVCEPFDYTITGAETATLICRRPDDTIFTYTGTVNAADNDVSIPMATEGGALTQVGDVDAELILTASGSTITSFKITIRVQEDISGEATPEEITFVAQLQAQVDAAFAAYQAALNAVQSSLSGYVPKTTKVNNKALSSDITLNASDVSAVPDIRTVNGHQLDSNVELDAADVGAVPDTRTVNGKQLNANATIEADDVPFTPTGTMVSTNVQDAIDEAAGFMSEAHEDLLYLNPDTTSPVGTYVLNEDVSGYQYLDIYGYFSAFTEVKRIPVVEDREYSLRFTNLADSENSTFLGFSEIGVIFSGSIMTVTHNKYENWSGNVASNPVISSSGKPCIVKVMGIKYDALGSGGGGGTSNYNDLTNKPQINSVELSGNKSLGDLGIIPAPTSPATGAFLVWDGDDWVAQTLSAWSASSY